MGVSEPRGPASTHTVLVITRMTRPNDVYVYIIIDKMVVMNELLEVKACSVVCLCLSLYVMMMVV